MKNLIKVFILSAVLVSMSGYANKTSLGSGEASCGAWTDERSKDSRIAARYGDWVLGFLTGANSIIPGDMLKGHGEAGLLGWMDRYCKKNPLKKIVDSVDRLSKEITHGE